MAATLLAHHLPKSTQFDSTLQTDVIEPLTQLCTKLEQSPSHANAIQSRLIGKTLRCLTRLLSSKIVIDKNNRAQCVDVLLRLSVSSKLPLSSISSLASMCTAMLCGAKRINPVTGDLWLPNDYIIEWRPLYDHFVRVHVQRAQSSSSSSSSSESTARPILDPRVSTHQQVMLGLIRRARIFFPMSAVNEIITLVEGDTLGVSLSSSSDPVDPFLASNNGAPGRDLLRWSFLATFLPLPSSSSSSSDMMVVSPKRLLSWTTSFWSHTPWNDAQWSPVSFDFLRRISKYHEIILRGNPAAAQEIRAIWIQLLPSVIDRMAHMVSTHVDRPAYEQTRRLAKIVGRPTTPKSCQIFDSYSNQGVATALSKGCKLLGHVLRMSMSVGSSSSNSSSSSSSSTLSTEDQMGDEVETTVLHDVLRLLHTLSPAYHPSSTQSNFHQLGRLLYGITTELVERTTATSGKSSRMVEQLSTLLMTLALRLTYSRDLHVQQYGQNVVRSVAKASPSVASRLLLERMEGALSGVDSSHQAPSVLRSFSYAMKSILLAPTTSAGKRTMFPALIDLLRLSLPGLDPDDTSKTIATIACYVQLFSWLHPGSCSILPEEADGSSHEIASRLEVGLEEFLPILVDRIMALVKSSDQESGIPAKSFAAQMESARDVALSSLCVTLTSGMSNEQVNSLLQQLLPHVLANPCRGGNRSTIKLTSGSIVFLEFVGTLVQRNPKNTSEYLLKFLKSKISTIKNNLNDSMSEFVWYNHVLSTMILNMDGPTILQHQNLFQQCIALGYASDNQVLFKSSVSLLRNVVKSLIDGKEFFFFFIFCFEYFFVYQYRYLF